MTWTEAPAQSLVTLDSRPMVSANTRSIASMKAVHAMVWCWWVTVEGMRKHLKRTVYVSPELPKLDETTFINNQEAFREQNRDATEPSPVARDTLLLRPLSTLHMPAIASPDHLIRHIVPIVHIMSSVTRPSKENPLHTPV